MTEVGTFLRDTFLTSMCTYSLNAYFGTQGAGAGHRVLVFAQTRAVLDLVERLFAEASHFTLRMPILDNRFCQFCQLLRRCAP